MEGEGGNQTETDLELETSESIMYIRMSEEEWVTTSQTHGLNHYIPAVATRWRTIQPADEDLNSVIPAAIVADLERDWGQFPRIFLVSDDFQELQLGTLLALRSYRVPNYDPEGRNASFIKAFKIRNDVLNIEEVIVLWIHRSVTVRRVPREEQPRGAGDGPAQDLDPRRELPRIAAMRAGQPDQRVGRGVTQQGNQAEQSPPQPSGVSWGGYEADGEHGEDDSSLPSSTLRAPGIEVSSSTPGPNSVAMTSSSSGVKPIEPSSGLGGHRVDSRNVPGGRVDLSLQWSIRFQPDEHSDDSVAVSSMPLLSLPEEERDRLRNRTMWLMDFVEEERAIQRQRIERGEYPTQEQHQAFYRLDQAIEHLVEVLQGNGTPLDDVRLRAVRLDPCGKEPEESLRFEEVLEEELAEEGEARMMKATQETLYTPNIEDLLAAVSPENPLKVTHTVDPREVLPVVERWVPAMKAELNSLEQMPAIKKHRGCEAAALRRDPQLVVVPSKLVFTVKPGVLPGEVRRKVRGVACGNFSGETAEELGDVYSAGATIDLVRLCLAEANAHPGWIAATDDIKTAFLRAPIPELPNGKRYAMEAPRAMIRAGLAEPGELWLATAAVCGFQRSPKWWSQHRNATTAKASWKSKNGGVLKIVPCITDENLHKLVETHPDGSEEIKGYVLFYVDDTLAVGPPEYVHGFYDWLAATWETSGREVVSKDAVVRFLGLELSIQPDGRMKIAQRGYLDELLRRREVTGYSKVPFDKEWAAEEIPEDVDRSPALIKEAQQSYGEILWTTQRTRPDASYAAMMMARLTTKWPERAIQIAKKILCYYNATRDAGFIVERSQDSKLAMFSDASHSPTGSKSFSWALVMWRGLPICWRAANQGLTALSSAEAELIALSEGAQLVRSVKTTLADMGIMPEVTELRVDATAAIAVASSGGSWRTRHLRLRENWLVELVNSEEYQLLHQPGVEQLADGLTKQLASDRVWKLLELWGFYKGHVPAVIKKFNREYDEVMYEAAAEVTAAATAATTAPDVSQSLSGGTLSRCIQVLIGLGLLAEVTGEETGGQPYTGVSSEHELWIAVLLVMITTIFVWEWSKRAAGSVKKTVKMKMFKRSPMSGLSKGEGKELLALLRIDDRSIEQEARLTFLIAKFQDSDMRTLRDGEASGASMSRGGSRGRTPTTSSSSSRPTVQSRERFQPEKWSRAVQTDPEVPPGVPSHTVHSSAVDTRIRYIVQPWEGDLFVSPNGDRVHLRSDCHGLRNAARAVRKPMCQYCLNDWRNHPDNTRDR